MEFFEENNSMYRFLLFIVISSYLGCNPETDLDTPYFNVSTNKNLDARIKVTLDTQKIESTPLDQGIRFLLSEKPGHRVKYLAIHCTASPPSNSMQDIAQLAWWQQNRGWNRWGYHVVFFRSGEMSILNPAFKLDEIMEPAELVYGIRGINRHTINIAYVGGVTEEKVANKNGITHRLPEDNMTIEQYHAMAGFIQAVKAAIPKITIAGHRDFRKMLQKPKKACPSFDVLEKFGSIIPTHNRLNI